jgi:hypothetical protein
MRSLFAVTLTILLASPVVAGSPPRPAVHDEAKLFGPEAVKRAEQLISGIRDEYHIDLRIDTLTELPGADPSKLRSMSNRQRAKFLREIAQQRADDEGVNGIYVLVTTQPRNVVLIGWPELREVERGLLELRPIPLEKGGGLSKTKRESRMRVPFAREIASNPDDALLRLVDHFRMALKDRETPPPSPLETVPALILVGILVGAWVLLRILRGAVARRQTSALGEPCPRLYQPAMLGSLFGVPAGFWIYDRLFRSERPPAGSAIGMATAPPAPEPRVEEHSQAPAEITDHHHDGS